MRKFNPPEKSFIVVQQNGTISIESGGGFFACFGVICKSNCRKNSMKLI